MDSLVEFGDDTSLCQAVMAAAPDAILLTDLVGNIVLANDQTEQLFGYPVAELLGRPVEMLVPESVHTKHQRHRASYVRLPKRRRMGEMGRVEAQHKDGHTVPVSIALAPVKTLRGHFVVCVVRDERDAQKRENELRRLSTTDQLTGVYNRAYFEAELERLESGRRAPISIIIGDIDGLKPINDRFGHAAGDSLIRRASVVLRSAFRSDDVVARIGGDEFAVLLPGVGADKCAETLAQLEEDIARHNDVIGGHMLRISIGGATAETPGGLREAMREADAKMYSHKNMRRRARRSSVPPTP